MLRSFATATEKKDERLPADHFSYDLHDQQLKAKCEEELDQTSTQRSQESVSLSCWDKTESHFQVNVWQILVRNFEQVAKTYLFRVVLSNFCILGQKDLISYYGALFYADSSCQYGSSSRTADSNGVSK